MTREVLEAFYIVTLGDQCTSEASIALSEKEIEFLQERVRGGHVVM